MRNTFDAKGFSNAALECMVDTIRFAEQKGFYNPHATLSSTGWERMVDEHLTGEFPIGDMVDGLARDAQEAEDYTHNA